MHTPSAHKVSEGGRPRDIFQGAGRHIHKTRAYFRQGSGIPQMTVKSENSPAQDFLQKKDRKAPAPAYYFSGREAPADTAQGQNLRALKVPAAGRFPNS